MKRSSFTLLCCLFLASFTSFAQNTPTDTTIYEVAEALPYPLFSPCRQNEHESWTSDSVRRCAQKKLLENFQIADELLQGRDWFFDHFTAVDAYFFWCFRRAIQFGMDVSGFGHCVAHQTRMGNRASVQKLVAYEASVLEGFKKAD